MCCWQASKIALKSKQSRRLRPTGAHATKLFVFLFSRRQSLIYCHCRLHAISQSLSLQPPWCAPGSFLTASSQGSSTKVLRSYLQQSLFDASNFERLATLVHRRNPQVYVLSSEIRVHGNSWHLQARNRWHPDKDYNSVVEQMEPAIRMMNIMMYAVLPAQQTHEDPP